MINRLLPRNIDNTYRGHKLALWILAVVVTVRALQGLLAIIDGRYIVVSADGIPLDTYAPAASQTIVALFALTGFARLTMSVLCALGLALYRSATSAMFALLALDFLFRLLILYFVPIVRVGASPGVVVNLALFCLVIVGLALSLWRQKEPKALA